MEELEMTTYEKDSTASAIVLYEEMDTRYEWDTDLVFFKVVTRYFVRIKILTNEGLSEADQYIVRYLGKTNADVEHVSGLSGYTYNLVNGKIQQTKLSKEHIFEEKTSDIVSRIKFAFQSVTPGSVIEYKYQLLSPSYWRLDNYYFQRPIPVKYSKYYLKIPEYFFFSQSIGGVEPILYNGGTESQTVHMGRHSLSFTANTHEFIAKDLPGLNSEDYVWSIRDFLSRVIFELHSIIIPGVTEKKYSNTWEKVDEQLLENKRFGKQFDYRFFTNESPALLAQKTTNTEKVRAIYYLVKSSVKWNDKNTFWVDDPKEALEKGIGPSGEINAILISSLRAAGFDAYPIAMRIRDSGRIPLSYSTIDSFNYFIVAVTVDGKPVYLDAAEKYGDLNVLSPSCLPDYARSIRGGKRSAWVDMTNISKSTGVKTIAAKFNEDGYLSGKISETGSNQVGFTMRNRYSRSKDERSFFDNLASAQNITILSPTIENIDNTGETVKLDYEFIKNDVVLGDDYIYFNPLVSPLFDENPFKAEDRKLPIEFPYSHDRRINVTFEIPEGYIVEELPKSIKIVINERNGAIYQYIITENKETRMVTVALQFLLNKIAYTLKKNTRHFGNSFSS